MKIKTNKINLCKLMNDIFRNAEDVEQIDGYCTLVPLSGNYVEINHINHYFPDNKKVYLSFNEYGQMSVEYKDGDKEDYPYERTTPTRLFISWNLNNLKQIYFTAPNKYEKINPKTGKKYYSSYTFIIE